MTDPEFLTFDRFVDRAQAEELCRLLEENKIPVQLEDDSEVFDPTFSFSDVGKSFNVKLRPDDFRKAEELIENLVLGDLENVGSDYYLYSFTDAELKDLIAHKDQWSAFDFVLAQKVLRERGHSLSKEELEEIRGRRLEELSAPEKDQSGWILAGYIFAVLGGWAGLIIGWHLSSFKKTLPNGQRVYAFTDANRKHGKRILWFSVVVITASVLYWFNKEILLR